MFLLLHQFSDLSLLFWKDYKWSYAIYSNMDGPEGCDAKWHKSEKDNTIWFHLYVETKNKMNKYGKQQEL